MRVGPQPLGNAFRVVQTIDRQQNLSPTITLDPFGIMLGRLVIPIQQLRIFLGSDPNGKSLQTNGTAPQGELRDLAFHAKDSEQRRPELLQMAVGLEGKQVCPDQSLEEFFTPG